MAEELEGYITVNEAARKMGRSTEQVRRYLREGKLVGRRIGGQWFIREPAVMYQTREKVMEVPRELSDPERIQTVDVPDRLALYERIARRRETIRHRWEALNLRVDAAELVREIREEEA